MEDYRPRFSAEISPEQAQILGRILPHGLKRPIVSAFVNGVIELHQAGGAEALGAIMSKTLTLDQICTIGYNRTRLETIAELKKRLKELQKEGTK